MDTLFDQEILNTAFINDAFSNLKKSRVLSKCKKKRSVKKIGKFGNSKQIKSPTVRKLNGVFKTMTKQSSPIKCANPANHNIDDSLIDYSIWIQNLNENISNSETCEQFDQKFNETMEVGVLEDLMKKICAITK